VVLLFTEAEEVLDPRAGVHAALPLRGGLPGELRGLRRTLQHIACIEECLDVYAVVGRGGHVV
jgi:hypothetical protein